MQCDTEGEIMTVNLCEDQTPAIQNYQNLIAGADSAYLFVESSTDFSTFYTTDGLLYGFNESSDKPEPVYYYDTVGRYKNIFEKSSKNFEEILTNLIKIISFAKQ